MKKVFISGPYTALSEEERQKVVELATKVAAQYMAMGYSPREAFVTAAEKGQLTKTGAKACVAIV
jgi:dihydrodipicolinate synthase/N-acetylneuraminate lyase